MIGLDQKKRAHDLENQSVSHGPRLLIYLYFVFFHCFFYPCCSNFVKLEDMLWIEEIVESTPTPPFFTNSRVDIVGLVNLHKVVARNAFLVFPSAQNGVEL